jgi:hypothetical protein
MENQSPITFSFSLPVGLLDNQDRRHRDGEMRLATGKDELYQTDPRSLENPAYGDSDPTFAGYCPVRGIIPRHPRRFRSTVSHGLAIFTGSLQRH